MNRILSAAVLLGAFLIHPAGAAQTPAARQVLTLRPGPAQGPTLEFDYSGIRALPPFEKEPVLAGKEIARGLIPTVPPTPLIRNHTDQELYLKADHGQDFTVGPPVTYQGQCDDGVHVNFSKVRVFSERGALTIPYAVRIFTYRHGYSGRLFAQSGW